MKVACLKLEMRAKVTLVNVALPANLAWSNRASSVNLAFLKSVIQVNCKSDPNNGVTQGYTGYGHEIPNERASTSTCYTGVTGVTASKSVTPVTPDTIAGVTEKTSLLQSSNTRNTCNPEKRNSSANSEFQCSYPSIDDYEERAAILEYEGNYERTEAERLAAIECGLTPRIDAPSTARAAK